MQEPTRKELPKASHGYQKENPLTSLLFNIALPFVVLHQLSDLDRLGPVWALIVGLSFPLGYGLWDFFRNKKANFISILGFVSVLLTGGFGLLEVDTFWFAVKEGAVPLVIGIAVVGSLWTRYPLVRSLLYSDKIINVELVDEKLKTLGNTAQFDRLLVATTWLLAMSFVLSAVLNFGLAIYILKSPAGTPEFNKELGKMTALSYPVIVLPCMVVMALALWRLMSGIKKLTGLGFETIFKTPPK